MTDQGQSFIPHAYSNAHSVNFAQELITPNLIFISGFVDALTNIKTTDDKGVNICPHCENELKSGFLSVEDTRMYFISRL